MDAALILKQKVDAGEISGFNQASSYLEQSRVVKALLADFDFDVLNLLNRLTEISEIPFAHGLEKVQKWLNKLGELAFCEDGFSFSGKSDDMLSCYNSMIVSILLRMNYPLKERIKKGIDWILDYQNLERGAENKWTGSRIFKYGGCMRSTPCYIGIVKAMIALTDFKKRADYVLDANIEKKLEKGLAYILDHQIYLRHSKGQPITADILKLTYPFSYKTNVIEILRLLKDNNLASDKRCDLAKAYIQSKMHKDGFWRVNSSYLPKCWVLFDETKDQGKWISYEIGKLLNKSNIYELS